MSIVKMECNHEGCSKAFEIDANLTYYGPNPWYCVEHTPVGKVEQPLPVGQGYHATVTCHTNGCTETIPSGPNRTVPYPWFCEECARDRAAWQAPQPKTMKVPCSFPDCPGFHTIDPTEKQEMPFYWFCDNHKHTAFQKCDHDDCQKINVLASHYKNYNPWLCPEHLTGSPKPSAEKFGTYQGKCPHCDDDVRTMHASLRHPEGDLLYHSNCLVITLHEKLRVAEHDISEHKVLTFMGRDGYLDRALNEISRLKMFGEFNESNLRQILFQLCSNVESMKRD